MYISPVSKYIVGSFFEVILSCIDSTLKSPYIFANRLITKFIFYSITAMAAINCNKYMKRYNNTDWGLFSNASDHLLPRRGRVPA